MAAGVTGLATIVAAGPLTLDEAEEALSVALLSTPAAAPGAELADDRPRCATCQRPLARCTGPGEAGWTCVVCDDPTEPAPLEVCSCEEALALRAELGQWQARAEAAERALANRGDGRGARPWRVGTKVGRTLYDASNRLIGMLDTPELAALAVRVVNAVEDGPAFWSLVDEDTQRADVEHYRTLWDNSRETIERQAADVDRLQAELLTLRAEAEAMQVKLGKERSEVERLRSQLARREAAER